MTDWKTHLIADPLPWLFEPDPENPGVRYFALTDLLDRPSDDPEVLAARRVVMTSGPVPIILEAQERDGYWVKPGSGYGQGDVRNRLEKHQYNEHNTDDNQYYGNGHGFR